MAPSCRAVELLAISPPQRVASAHGRGRWVVFRGSGQRAHPPVDNLATMFPDAMDAEAFGLQSLQIGAPSPKIPAQTGANEWPVVNSFMADAASTPLLLFGHARTEHRVQLKSTGRSNTCCHHPGAFRQATVVCVELSCRNASTSDGRGMPRRRLVPDGSKCTRPTHRQTNKQNDKAGD